MSFMVTAKVDRIQWSEFRMVEPILSLAYSL